VRHRYLSARALALHAALVVWLGSCAAADWWQVGRAIHGNQLSYLYVIEWPLFAVLGVLGWYALLRMESPTDAETESRRAFEDRMRAEAVAAREAQREDEDPGLAAYNDHLAALARQPKRRLFGH
jgi:DNA-binding transcriptional regulator of glucitol operon